MANRRGKSRSSDRFSFPGSKITVNSECSHGIKRCLFLGRKAMTNLDCILKSRDITLLTNVRIVKAMIFFLAVMYKCDSWTIKKAKCQRIYAFKLWCWRRFENIRIDWFDLKAILNIHWKNCC